jgi:hypothetical protein
MLSKRFSDRDPLHSGLYHLFLLGGPKRLALGPPRTRQ